MIALGAFLLRLGFRLVIAGVFAVMLLLIGAMCILEAYDAARRAIAYTWGDRKPDLSRAVRAFKHGGKV